MTQLINSELIENLRPFFVSRREWNARATASEDGAITDIVAGSGLSGGGSTGSVTLNASVGDGIAIDTDNIVVDLASPSGLSFATGQLQIDDSIAGTGLSIAGKVLSVTDSVSGAAGDGLVWDAGNSEIDVNPGNGIAIVGDAVAVDLATDSGLTFSTGELTLGTPGTLSVSSTSALSGSSHSHAITSSSNPGAASRLLASDASGYLSLQRLGIGATPSYPLHIQATDATQFRLAYDVSNYADFQMSSGGILTMLPSGNDMRVAYDADSYISMLPADTSSQIATTHALSITPTGNLTLDPTGDIYLNPTGDDVLPNGGYEVNLGALNDKFLTLHAAELWVETLVAQDTIATIGGRVLVGPTTKLIADLGSSTASGSSLFTNGNLESWSGGSLPAPWTYSNGNGVVQTDIAHGGNYSALLFPYNDDPVTRIVQTLTVSASTQYNVSFWVYTTGIENSKPRIRIYDNANGVDIIELSEIDTTLIGGQWTQHEFSFYAPSNATTVTFYCYAPKPASQDSKSAYIAGVDTDVNALDSQGAYIEGGYPDGVSSKSAYIEGYGSPNSKSAYIEGAHVPWVLVDDFSAVPTNYIDVEHNEMVAGDIAYMEAAGKVEFFRVISSPEAISGGYRYGVERNVDGSGANQWYAGDAVFNTGAEDDGFIDLYSLNGITSGTVGPAIVGNVRNSNTYNDWSERWAIGNLNGVYGYSTDEYAIGLGDVNSEHLTIDVTNGLRIYGNDGTTIYTELSQGLLKLGSTTSSNIELASTGITLRSASAVVGQWDTDGDIFIGSDISSPGTTHFSVFANQQTYNSELVSAGSLLIGDNSGSTSLLSDGDFENWATPSNLIYWLESGGSVSREVTNVQSGFSSVKLTESSGRASVSQEVDVSGSTYYTLTGWHRPGGTLGSYRVYDVTNSSWLTTEINGPGATSAFYYFETEFQTNPTTGKIRIYLYGPTATSQEAYFDNVALYEGPYINIFYDRGAGNFDVRRGTSTMTSFRRGGDVLFGKHYTLGENYGLVEMTERGLEINIDPVGQNDPPGIYVNYLNYDQELLRIGGEYSTNGTSYGSIDFIYQYNGGSNQASITIGHDDTLGAQTYIDLTAGVVTTSSNISITDSIIASDAVVSKVYRSSDSTLTGTSNNTITWNAETYDPFNMHDNSTNPGRVTVPYAGEYLVHCSLIYSGSTATRIDMRILLDGSSVGENTGATTTNNRTSSITGVITCSANQYIQIQVYPYAGITILGGQYYSYLRVIRIA